MSVSALWGSVEFGDPLFGEYGPQDYLDSSTVVFLYVPSGSDLFTAGGTTDAATVVLEIIPSGAEYITHAYVDAGTVVFRFVLSSADIETTVDTSSVTVRLVISGTDTAQFVDTKLVPYLLVISAHECYFPLQPAFVFTGTNKWFFPDELQKWQYSGTNKWAFQSGETEPAEC